jgi:chaperonin GroES
MIKALGHHVLIEVEKVEKTTERYTKAGIYIPEKNDLDTEDKRKQLGKEKGIVSQIGKYAWKDYADGKAWVKVGDTVYFKRYDGVDHEVEGKHYKIVNDLDIIAVEE